ncbi:MAG: hypothetical protein R3F24_10695 [Gammaproteobacteria bacterium]
MAAELPRSMRNFGANSTHWLSRATFEPKAGYGRRKQLVLPLLLIVAAMLTVSVRSGYVHLPFMTPSRLMEAEQANTGLIKEIEHTRTELAVERATRAELQRQADDLSGQVNRLTQQLEFLSSRGARNRSSTMKSPEE